MYIWTAHVMECIGCLKELENLRLLPCDHQYCLSCLGVFKKRKGWIQCRVCKSFNRVPLNGINGFEKKEFFSDTEVDEGNVQYVCDVCDEPHNLDIWSLCKMLVYCSKHALVNHDMYCLQMCRMKVFLLHVYRKRVILPKYKEKLAFLTSYHDHHKCSKCWKFSIKRKMCSSCATAGYCSKECQIKDWEGKHKEECREMKLSRNIIYDENYPLCPEDIPTDQKLVQVAIVDSESWELELRTKPWWYLCGGFWTNSELLLHQFCCADVSFFGWVKNCRILFVNVKAIWWFIKYCFYIALILPCGRVIFWLS